MTRDLRPPVIVLAVLLAALALPQPAAAEQAESWRARVSATSVAVGASHTCVVTPTARVKCWGLNGSGQLGYPGTITVGDFETPADVPAVDVGGKVGAIALGNDHTCALLLGGAVRCWGSAAYGQLGYGNTENIGDDETPASAGNVPLGGKAIAITAGSQHSCALLATLYLRCWGLDEDGRLGMDVDENVGDDETPAQVGTVEFGGLFGTQVIAVSAGTEHTCAIDLDHRAWCWGNAANGRLGVGPRIVPVDPLPKDWGPVPLDDSVSAISAGHEHTCVVLETGRARCWGEGSVGRLGYGTTEDIGDNESAAAADDLALGAGVLAVSAGAAHTCATLVDARLLCWGNSAATGFSEHVGDDEPATGLTAPLLDGVAAVATAWSHSCLTRVNGRVRCWGSGDFGQLGYGDSQPVVRPYGSPDVTVGSLVRVRAATRLDLSLDRSRDRRAPYTFRIEGRVRGAFFADTATCRGTDRVTVVTRTPQRKLKQRVDVGSSCDLEATVRLSRSQIGRLPAPIRITVKLAGSRSLTPASRTVRVTAG